MRIAVPLVLLLACLPVPGQQETLVLPAYDQTSSSYNVMNVGLNGSVSTLANLPSFTSYQIVQTLDNTGYRVIGQLNLPGYSGAVLNVDAQGRVTTVVSSPLLQAAALMVADKNGDWIIATRAANMDTTLLRLRGGTLTTITTAVNLAIDGFSFDPASGQLLVRGFLNKPLLWGYFRVDPRNGTVTTFTLPAWGIRNMGVGSRAPLFRGKDGDFLDLFVHNQKLEGALINLSAENGVTTLNTFGNYTYPSDLIEAGGRAFPVRYRALIYQTMGKNQSSVVHLTGDGTAVGVLPLPGLGTFQRTSFARAGGRHLSWKQTVPLNDRILNLSFPGEGGRPFVVGASLNGTCPGLPLKDGRVIPLAIDVLTGLCLSGGIPGLLEGTVGLLDASGRAAVKVNANPLGPGVKGVRIWFAAVVLDPSAPSAVAHIVGPDLIELR